MKRGYYFITDPGLTRRGIIKDAEDAVRAGAVMVQYRNKPAAEETILDEIKKIQTICVGVPLIINDRVDLVLELNADGVHLGEDDMSCRRAREVLGPDKIIGVTVRSVSEALAAERAGASYLGAGPIFVTTIKENLPGPFGAGLIKEIKEACSLPVAAIGGITLLNAQEVIDAGCDMICALSSVITADDIKKEVAKFRKLF